MTTTLRPSFRTSNARPGIQEHTEKALAQRNKAGLKTCLVYLSRMALSSRDERKITIRYSK